MSLGVLSQSTMRLVRNAMKEGMVGVLTALNLTVAEERTVGAKVSSAETALAEAIAVNDVLALVDVSSSEVVALDERVMTILLTERARSWPVFFLADGLRGVGPGVTDGTTLRSPDKSWRTSTNSPGTSSKG
jgi:hypothetical protein